MGSEVRRIVCAAGAAKDNERISFTFLPTDQHGTTVATCKFDRKGLLGHLRHWQRSGHWFNERRWNDLESLLWEGGHWRKPLLY